MTNLNDLINAIDQDIKDSGGNGYADLVESVSNGITVATKDIEALLPKAASMFDSGSTGNPDLLELLVSRAIFTANKSADNIKNLIAVAEKDSNVKTSIQNAAAHILLNLESLDDSDGYLFVNSTENAIGSAADVANKEFTNIIGEKLLPYANFKQDFEDVSDLASMVVGITKRYMSHKVTSTVVQNFVDGALKNVSAFANATMFNWLHDVFHQNYVPVDLPSDIEKGELLMNQGWSAIKGMFESHAKSNGITIPVVNVSYEPPVFSSTSVNIVDKSAVSSTASVQDIPVSQKEDTSASKVKAPVVQTKVLVPMDEVKKLVQAMFEAAKDADSLPIDKNKSNNIVNVAKKMFATDIASFMKDKMITTGIKRLAKINSEEYGDNSEFIKKQQSLLFNGLIVCAKFGAPNCFNEDFSKYKSANDATKNSIVAGLANKISTAMNNSSDASCYYAKLKTGYLKIDVSFEQDESFWYKANNQSSEPTECIKGYEEGAYSPNRSVELVVDSVVSEYDAHNA